MTRLITILLDSSIPLMTDKSLSFFWIFAVFLLFFKEHTLSAQIAISAEPDLQCASSDLDVQ